MRVVDDSFGTGVVRNLDTGFLTQFELRMLASTDRTNRPAPGPYMLKKSRTIDKTVPTPIRYMLLSGDGNLHRRYCKPVW